MTSRLHILNKAPDHPRYQHCLEALEAGDVLVLIESGVLTLTTEVSVESVPDDVQLYAIRNDMAFYSQSPVPEYRVKMIDYSELVELVCRIGSPVSW